MKGNPRVHVTSATIVPDKPKNLLSEPDDVSYHMKVQEIDEKVETLNTEIKEVRSTLGQERSDMSDGQQARNPIRKEVNEQLAELRTFTDKRM